ncbi:MAG: hypothetical protein ABI581_07690 [Sediminibacterium sp.]
MKNNKIVLWAIAILAFVLLIFARPAKTGSVFGSIMPHGSASQVWLYSGTDTLRSPVQDDVFNIINVKAGAYSLVIDPMPTYKSNVRTGIKVNDGEATNVGEIIMEQIKK